MSGHSGSHGVADNFTDSTTGYLENGIRIFAYNYTHKELSSIHTNNIFYYSILFPLAFAGNIFTLSAVIMVLKVKKNIPNLLIGALAANDIVALLSCHIVPIISMTRGQYVGNLYYCYFQSMMAYSYFKFGFLMKCCISLDRYIALAHPLRYTNLVTFRRIIAAIVFNSLFAIVTSLATLFFDSQYINLLSTWYICVNNFKYYTTYKLLVCAVEGAIFTIGCILFFISNITVIKVMVKMNRQTKQLQSIGIISAATQSPKLDESNNNHNKFEFSSVTNKDPMNGNSINSSNESNKKPRSPTKDNWTRNCQHPSSTQSMENKKKKREFQRELQFARLVAVIVSVFVVLWLPYMTVIYWEHRNRSSVHPVLQDVVIKLVFANLCINPILYGVFNGNFRRAYVYYIRMLIFILTCKLIKRPVGFRRLSMFTNAEDAVYETANHIRIKKRKSYNLERQLEMFRGSNDSNDSIWTPNITDDIHAKIIDELPSKARPM